MRHCPNCGGEVIVWDKDLQADKCVDCGESWTLEEQATAIVAAHEHPRDRVTLDGVEQDAWNYRTCRSCGELVPIGHSACGACGTVVVRSQYSFDSLPTGKDGD